MNILSVKAYLKEIGERIRLYRINQMITQKKIEEMSGVSERSISRLEQGKSIQMDNFIKILLALKLEDNFELLVPNQKNRPSYYLKENVKIKKRVRKSFDKKNNFVWGDEK